MLKFGEPMILSGAVDLACYSVRISLLAFVCLGLVACDLEAENVRKENAETDLKAICDKLYLPDGTAWPCTEITRDISKVVVWKRYTSDKSCEAIGKHFRDRFVENGWDPNLMSVGESGGGLATTDFDFRKDDYLVSVECEKRNENEIKKIIISCSWGLR